ncbi:MAG: hypothetical protein AAGK02_00585 [Pseudomonadota bacterium]
MQALFILLAIAFIIWFAMRTAAPRDQEESEARQALLEAERERDELRERIQVLERIVTDANTPDARKTKLLAEEIENLRDADKAITPKPKEDMSE